jgi:hypothetical protein
MNRTRSRTDEFVACRRRCFPEVVTVQEKDGKSFGCVDAKSGERLADFTADLMNRRREQKLALALSAEHWHSFFHADIPQMELLLDRAQKSLERLTAIAALCQFAQDENVKTALLTDRLKESAAFAKATTNLEKQVVCSSNPRHNFVRLGVTAPTDNPESLNQYRLRMCEKFKDAARSLRLSYGRLPKSEQAVVCEPTTSTQ